jgi:hypothetical protein
MDDLYLIVEFGSSGCKLVFFDKDGKIPKFTNTNITEDCKQALTKTHGVIYYKGTRNPKEKLFFNVDPKDVIIVSLNDNNIDVSSLFRGIKKYSIFVSSGHFDIKKVKSDAENRYNNLIPSLSMAIKSQNSNLPSPNLNEFTFSDIDMLNASNAATYEGKVEAMSYLKTETYKNDFNNSALPLLTVFMGGGSFQICEYNNNTLNNILLKKYSEYNPAEVTTALNKYSTTKLNIFLGSNCDFIVKEILENKQLFNDYCNPHLKLACDLTILFNDKVKLLDYVSEKKYSGASMRYIPRFYKGNDSYEVAEPINNFFKLLIETLINFEHIERVISRKSHHDKSKIGPAAGILQEMLQEPESNVNSQRIQKELTLKEIAVLKRASGVNARNGLLGGGRRTRRRRSSKTRKSRKNKRFSSKKRRINKRRNSRKKILFRKK